MEYPGGQSLHFTYKDRLVSSVTDHMGRKITYHYADGRLDHVNFSPENKRFIFDDRIAPIVDKQFIEHFPQYAAYEGDDIKHHHIGRGGQAYAIPETLHPGYGGVHNYEKLAGVTDNDYLTQIAQAIEDGSTNKRKKSSKKGKCVTKG